VEQLVLSRKYIYRKYEIKGSGTEADFFHLNKTTGLKLFRNEDKVQKTLPNKLKKIERTAGIEEPCIKYPKTPVFDDNGNLLGYTLTIALTAEYIRSFRDLSKPCVSLAQKIAFYKKLEHLVKLVHSKSMILVDTNPDNFLIDLYKNVVLIDTDNYMHSDCPCDNIPDYPAKYYVRKTGDQSFTYVDEFSLAIRFLEIAVDGFRRQMLEHLVLGRQFYVDVVVESLDIPIELKSVLLATISAKGKKEFIGPYLDCIADPNKRYIRINN